MAITTEQREQAEKDRAQDIRISELERTINMLAQAILETSDTADPGLTLGIRRHLEMLADGEMPEDLYA